MRPEKTVELHDRFQKVWGNGKHCAVSTSPESGGQHRRKEKEGVKGTVPPKVIDAGRIELYASMMLYSMNLTGALRS